MGVSGCFRGFLMVSQCFNISEGCFKGNSKKFQGGFNHVSKKFQMCVRIISWVFHEGFKLNNSMKVVNMK